MATIILIMLVVALFLCVIAIIYLKMSEKNDRLQRAANKDRDAYLLLKEQYREYRKNTAEIMYERQYKIRELSSQLELMSQMICPHESHIWDDALDSSKEKIKRYRRCGLERTVKGA